MPALDPDHLLALLRDPNVASAEIAQAAGVPREEAGRAARLVHGVARAKPEEVVTLPAPLAAAFLRAATAAGRIDLVMALGAHAEKEVVKEARRQVHLLRIRGVSVPEAARAAPPAPAPAPAEPAPPAYASTVDGQGERAVWLPRLMPGRGVEVAQAVLSDEKGLLELQVGVLGRKEWRAFVKGLLERGAEVGVAEIDRGRAHALVVAARALNEQAGARVPDGADRWLSQLGPAPVAEPPGASLPSLDPAEEAAALAASAELLALPILRGWLAEQPFLREVAARLDAADASPLEVSPEARRERLEGIVSAAVGEYFTPPRRARLSARLLDLAEHLTRRGDAGRARLAAAASRALSAGRPPEEVPFATALVLKAFPLDAPPASPAGPAGPLITPAR